MANKHQSQIRDDQNESRCSVPSSQSFSWSFSMELLKLMPLLVHLHWVNSIFNVPIDDVFLQMVLHHFGAPFQFCLLCMFASINYKFLRLFLKLLSLYNLHSGHMSNAVFGSTVLVTVFARTSLHRIAFALLLSCCLVVVNQITAQIWWFWKPWVQHEANCWMKTQRTITSKGPYGRKVVY